MAGTQHLPDFDATQQFPVHDPDSSPGVVEQLEQVAGPIVSIRYHSSKDTDGDPYERVEVDFHRAPPEQVLLDVLNVLLTSVRETVVTRDADGGAHIYGQREGK
jgi:hypothetical protein